MFCLQSYQELTIDISIDSHLIKWSVQVTVHSRYLGSKKPLGGLYHYINIGSFFLMFLDENGIKLYIRDDFSIKLCGVEDSVNYQTYLISCRAVMVFESYGIVFFFLLFSVLSLISRSFS